MGLHPLRPLSFTPTARLHSRALRTRTRSRRSGWSLRASGGPTPARVTDGPAFAPLGVTLERVVLRLVGQGLTIDEVGRILLLGSLTATTRITSKPVARDRVQFVVVASATGLVLAGQQKRVTRSGIPAVRHQQWDSPRGCSLSTAAGHPRSRSAAAATVEGSDRRVQTKPARRRSTHSMEEIACHGAGFTGSGWLVLIVLSPIGVLAAIAALLGRRCRHAAWGPGGSRQRWAAASPREPTPRAQSAGRSRRGRAPYEARRAAREPTAARCGRVKPSSNRDRVSPVHSAQVAGGQEGSP